jgi:hypothetical protein
MKSHQIMAVWGILMAALLVICGCRPPDQRLTELAETSLDYQSRQSQAVAENSRQIAEATRELVQADAAAREQFIQSSRELQIEISQGHKRIDQARAGLEAERKAITAQRQRDPIVAQAIGGVGLLIAALAPLIVVVVLLYVVHRAGPDEVAVSSLLIAEITSDQPRFASPNSLALVSLTPPIPAVLPKS